MIAQLKRLANKKDVPYQSLVKVFLSDRIESELAPSKTGRSSRSLVGGDLPRVAPPVLDHPATVAIRRVRRLFD